MDMSLWKCQHACAATTFSFYFFFHTVEKNIKVVRKYEKKSEKEGMLLVTLYDIPPAKKTVLNLNCGILAGDNVIPIAQSKAVGDCLLLNRTTWLPSHGLKRSRTHAYSCTHAHAHARIPPKSQVQSRVPQALKGGAQGPRWAMERNGQREKEGREWEGKRERWGVGEWG